MIVLTSAACRFPNEINNIEDLWNALVCKRDCIDEIPLSR